MIKMRDTAAWKSPLVQETLSVLEAGFRPEDFNTLAHYMQLSDVLEPQTLCALIIMMEMECTEDERALRQIVPEEVRPIIDVFWSQKHKGFEAFFEAPTLVPLKLLLAFGVSEMSTHEAFATADKGEIQADVLRMANDVMGLVDGIIRHRVTHEVPEALLKNFCICAEDLSGLILDAEIRTGMQASLVMLRQAFFRPDSTSSPKKPSWGMN